MPDIQQANAIINKSKQKLATFQREASDISKNKDVVAWQKVNIDSFSEVIEALGLPGDLSLARDTYPNLARKVLKEIATLQNNVANLEADIKLGPLPANKAIPQAKKLEQRTNQLQPSISKLLQCKNSLESSSIALKKNINLKTLLPLARNNATGKKKSVFETGFTIYLTTTREKGFEEEDKINMFTYFDKATLLQKKLTELTLENISNMASSMLVQQIRLCSDGLQEVKDFILFVENYVKKDIDNINIFHTQLAKITQQPLTNILFNIPDETEKVGACIRDFTHKKFLLEEIDRVAQLLLMIEQFQQIVQDHFLDYLHQQGTLENGLLNPFTLADARAHSYFSGFKGLWRMIRLLLGNFTQQEPLSEEILKETLLKMLDNCSNFFGQGQADRENLETFIESYFHTFKSPFPHNELVDVSKKCLITYGTILEKVMFRYKVEQNNTSHYSLGRLSGKIEIRMTNLKKYRKKLSPS